MLRTVFIVLFCLTGLLWADNMKQKLSLSLEECLALAEKESLTMLRAESAKQKLDFQVIYQWLNYVPRLEYGLDSYYADESNLVDNRETSHTRNFQFEHKFTFTQRLFDSKLVELCTNEKNEKIKREIIALSFKSAVSCIVREAYYNALIYGEKILALEQYRNLLQTGMRTGADVYAQLLQDHLLDFLTELELALTDTRHAVEAEKRVILKTMQKPLNTELILTSPPADFDSDFEKDTRTALQNNVYLKRFLLEKMIKENEISLLKYSCLPRISVSLSDQFNKNMSVELNADLFKYSSDPFAVDLNSSLVLAEDRYDYNFTTNTWDKYDLYSNMNQTGMKAEVVITIPLQQIVYSANKQKEEKNGLYDLELKTREQVLAILQNLASLAARMEYANEILQILDKKILIKQRILKTTGVDLKLTQLSDINLFREELNAVLQLINRKFDTLEKKFVSQNQYLAALESGTSSEMLP